MVADVYPRSRERITALARALAPARLAEPVPATPRWTALEVVAHLTGVASDAVHGRVDGMPGPAWTAAQVTARRDRGLEELLVEWAEVGPAVDAALAARRLPLPVVHDVLTHECDLREAFAAPLPAAAAADLEAALDPLARGLVRRAAGDGGLTLRAGGREWTAGTDGPSVEVEPYELHRGLMSRRTAAQLRAWPWSADPGGLVERLPAFGPADG